MPLCIVLDLTTASLPLVLPQHLNFHATRFHLGDDDIMDVAFM